MDKKIRDEIPAIRQWLHLAQSQYNRFRTLKQSAAFNRLKWR
jgi:hypothetical protein